jgi:hypothetical protein
VPARHRRGPRRGPRRHAADARRAAVRVLALVLAPADPARSRFEAYDRVEGQAALAEKTAALGADGAPPSKAQQKEVDQERAHQLAMRHRGVMQFAPARTALWSKQGIKSRASRLKAKITGDSTREPTAGAESEA